MKPTTLLPMFAILFAVLSPEASAQFNRTAVSANGSDANSCTVASPCRSFTRALSQTNSGGEVIALDSGGYGPFTVDRSATIMAAPGVYAGITATTSGNGIFINADANARVVLRNLFINGLHLGTAGVSVTGPVAGANLEHLVIDGFVNWGVISFFPVVISDTTIRSSGTGIWIDNAGAAVSAMIERVMLTDIGGGTSGFPGRGVIVRRNADVTVRDSVATFMPIGFQAMNNGVLTVENCVATHNNVGIWSDDTATVRISNNVVTHNQTGVVNFSVTSTIESWSNNKVAGNAINNTSGPIRGIGFY